MDIDVFAAREQPHVFRVLRTALNPAAPLDDRELRFLQTYARITGYALPAGDPVAIAPQDVEIHGPHQRKRLVQLAALAVLLSHPVRPRSVQFLRNLARNLFTHDAVVDVVHALHEKNHLKVKLLARRRAFRAIFKEAYLAEGVMGIVRFVAAMLLKAPVNRDKLWNYKRLGLLPDGTLGREYWKHLTEVGFGFPGEPGGIADSGAYHDVAHVLAEHDTTPEGEIQQGSFQGGNRREDGFFFIQFVVLHFHHGIKITPVAPPTFGRFDPEKVLWAIHRGAKCNVDLTHQWNFWPLMKLPLADARAQIALLPRI
jgi:ubiquinone biosynthesis protein Coq4